MRVLLLDTAFAAAPIYHYLIAAGHDVCVMGHREKDLLAVIAGDRWIQQDYSKVEAVAAHVQRLKIDAVVPGCTDVSIETCLKLGLNPNLHDSIESNTILSNKAAFRQLCVDLDLPAPRQISTSTFPRSGRFICKPVDAFSGKGITVFDGENTVDLSNAINSARLASSSGDILIETFTEGQLYSCSAFIKNGALRDKFYVIEGSSANPFAVDTSCIVDDISDHCSQKLEDGLETICRTLQLKDGLLHTQFILSDGEPYIVELTRRCPGDLYSLLIEYSTGFRYAAKYAAAFLGECVNTEITGTRHILRHTVTSLEHSIYAGLQFKEPQSVTAFFPIISMGEQLLPMQRNRAGILFTEAKSRPELIKNFSQHIDRQAYTTTAN